MKQSITFRVYDGETKVAVKELHPGCTIEMVSDALAREKITYGIKWETIADVTEKANTSGTTLTDIIIANSGEAGFSVQYGKCGPIFSGEEAEKSKENLSLIGRTILTNDIDIILNNGIFIDTNEPALTFRISSEFRNVYGEVISVSKKQKILPSFNSDRLTIKETADGYQLIAKVYGYLVINESDAWDIIDPFFASSDRLTLFSRIIPLVYGYESFMERLDRIVTSAADDIKALLTEADLCLQNIEIKKGLPPVIGRQGSIKFIISEKYKTADRSIDRMDYRDTGRFREVKEGDILVEIIPTIQSVPGVDVFGNEIPVEKLNEIDFVCGDGVIKKCETDSVKFIARFDGILKLKDNYVNVNPQLIIDGDVCIETGNIVYSRSVIVKGSVCSGFRIECGNLTVMGNIEDGVDIHCNGQFIAKKGIFGEHTRIFVNGDAEIGFIEGASTRVQGNCIIEKYAYHANIFCGGVLYVKGKGQNSAEKGCVIGGHVGGFNKLDLHSAGSASTLTTLYCGFDPERFETYKETLALEKTLKLKTIQLQKKLNMNSGDKALLLERIQNASEEQKEALKQALQELRTTIALAEKAGASIALLARKALSPEISRCSIIVRNQLIAPVMIAFVNTKKKIYRDEYNVSFNFKFNEIIMHEGCANSDENCKS